MRLILGVIFTLLLIVTGSFPATACELIDFEGHCYMAVPMDVRISWEEARDLAAAHAPAAHLVTISSEAENDFVFGLVDKAAFWFTNASHNAMGPWLGGYQMVGHTWQWIIGEPWGAFTAWSACEPNNPGAVDCGLHFFSLAAGVHSSAWNDERTDTPLRGYIVEFDEPCDTITEDAPASWGVLKAQYR
ncbi:MAG: lectin-like protein [bacterium]